MILSIIFMACLYPILPIRYFVLKMNSRSEKDIILGVTLPKEYLEDERVIQLCKLYNRELKRIAVLFAVLPIFFFFIKYNSITFTFWMIWMFGLILGIFIPYIRYNKKLTLLKVQQQWGDIDSNWIYGLFYYNRNDKKIMVEKRVGIGTTLNMATKPAKWIIGISFCSILIVPILCVWLWFLEFTPIQLKIQENQIIAEHLGEEYLINLKDITDVKLIDQLPSAKKVIGTNLDNLDKGSFSVESYGDCKLCLNPQNQSFIVIYTNKDIYILSDKDDKVTNAIYEQISHVRKLN